jgi:hypothetical protein
MNMYFTGSPPIPTTPTTAEQYYVTPTPPSYPAASSTPADYGFGNGGDNVVYPSSTDGFSLETSVSGSSEAIANCNSSSNQTAIIALGSICGLFFICICVLIFLLVLTGNRLHEAEQDADKTIIIRNGSGNSTSGHPRRQRSRPTQFSVNGRDEYAHWGLGRGHDHHRRGNGAGRSVWEAETTASKRRRTYPQYVPTGYAGMSGQPDYFQHEHGNGNENRNQGAAPVMQPAYFPGPRAPNPLAPVARGARGEEDVTEASDVGSSNHGGPNASRHSSVAGRRHHSRASGSTGRGRSARNV